MTNPATARKNLSRGRKRPESEFFRLHLVPFSDTPA